MCAFAVRIEAAATDRSLVSKRPARRRLRIDPQLLFWRRMIDHALADAIKVVDGLPTASAILARWWIENHKPCQKDSDEWERSFACACSWLSLDVATERKRLLDLIQDARIAAYRAYVESYEYQHRAAVLGCAGVRIAIAKQFPLPLVSDIDYEHVAGIEHADPPARKHERRSKAA